MSFLLNSVTAGSTKSVMTPTTSSDPALTHAVTAIADRHKCQSQTIKRVYLKEATRNY